MNPEDLDAIFGTPSSAASTPTPKRGIEIMPACGDCGQDLNPDNASKLRDGKWKHTSCPGPRPVQSETFPAVTPPDAPKNDPKALPPMRAGKKPKATEETVQGQASIPSSEKTVPTSPQNMNGISTTQLARAFRAFAEALEKS